MNYEEEDYSGKHVKNVLGRLVKYALKHKLLLFFVMGTMALMAVFDILYPQFSRYAIDNFILPQSTDGLLWYIVAYTAMVVISGFLVYAFVSQGGKLENYISYTIRRDAFSKLQRLPFSYYDTTPVGYIMARMISDVARLSEMIAWGLIDVLWSIIYLAGAVTAMFMMNAKLALLVLVVIPPLAVTTYFFQKRILELQRGVRKINSKITAGFNEGIMGAVTTKILVREEKNAEEFTALTGDMRAAAQRSARLSAFFIPIVLFLGSVGTALALWRGGYIAAQDVITFGTLSTFLSYSMNMFDPIQNLARIAVEFQSARAAAERVLSLIDEPLDIDDGDKVVAIYGDEFDPKTENWEPLNGDIEFRNVGFAYKTGERIFEDFNLSIKAGQSIAIVGETGAGKSTLVNLACRFYEPTEGAVLIDGRDYKERSQLWLQKSLGYVLQTPHLFSGTIAQNIAYADPTASMERVIEAAKAVNAHDFIVKFEKGYDSEVGEGGALLSTGQKQLISFARVVLANPRIFVLDEATSAVDTETEMLIQSAITHVLQSRTSLIIAHRLSTIRNSDRILVMDKGRIVEQGNHDELIALRGRYYNLYNLQLQAQSHKDLLS